MSPGLAKRQLKVSNTAHSNNKNSEVNSKKSENSKKLSKAEIDERDSKLNSELDKNMQKIINLTNSTTTSPTTSVLMPNNKTNVEQQQLLQLQQLQSQTTNIPQQQSHSTINNSKPQQQKVEPQITSQIPVAVKKQSSQQDQQQQIANDKIDDPSYLKIKRYPDLLNIKSAAGIGKRLAYTVSTEEYNDNIQQQQAQQESQIENDCNHDDYKTEEASDNKKMPRLEEGLSNDENDDNKEGYQLNIRNKTSDFIYKKHQKQQQQQQQQESINKGSTVE